MAKKRVLITGVYGQDGSFLAELFHEDGAEVYGICRPDLGKNSKSIKSELERESIDIYEYHTDLYDYKAIGSLISEIKPNCIFHMAATHRSSSDRDNNSILAEKELFDNNIKATSNLLAACLECSPESRILTAGSCLMFDDSETMLQDENTPFSSNSMYGISKIVENQLVSFYRNRGLFACTAILYNHESHRRTNTFLTKSIATKIREIAEGLRNTLEVGDLSIRKDWGYAGDYARAMKLMLEAKIPEDYVIATNEMHSVKEFINICARQLQINDIDSYLYEKPQLLTRKNNAELRGNPIKCETNLKWKRSMKFEQLVAEILSGGDQS